VDRIKFGFLDFVRLTTNEYKKLFVFFTTVDQVRRVGTKLVREPGAWSRERGKRERGAGIDVRIPEMKEFY
jgi:hypothetical protein